MTALITVVVALLPAYVLIRIVDYYESRDYRRINIDGYGYVIPRILGISRLGAKAWKLKPGEFQFLSATSMPGSFRKARVELDGDRVTRISRDVSASTMLSSWEYVIYRTYDGVLKVARNPLKREEHNWIDISA